MQSQNAISKSLHIWGINRLNLHPFAVHPRLVRKPVVEGRGVRRAERAVVVVRDLAARRFLRGEREDALQRHLRSSLRQAHGDLRGPVPPERSLVVTPPLVRFLTEFFDNL